MRIAHFAPRRPDLALHVHPGCEFLTLQKWCQLFMKVLEGRVIARVLCFLNAQNHLGNCIPFVVGRARGTAGGGKKNGGHGQKENANVLLPRHSTYI